MYEVFRIFQIKNIFLTFFECLTMPIGQPADSCVKRCEIIIQFISALSLFELKRQGSYWSIMVKFLSLLPLREGVCCPQGHWGFGVVEKKKHFFVLLEISLTFAVPSGTRGVKKKIIRPFWSFR